MRNLTKAALVLITLSLFPITLYSFQDNGSIVLILNETQKLQEDRNEYQTVINEHMRNLGKLNDQGVIQNVAGIEGGGELIFMSILDTKNASEVIQEDPAIKESLYTYETLAFDFLKGNLCDPDIPYETSAYDLIFLSFINEIATLKTGVNSENITHYKQLMDEITQMEEVIMVSQYLDGNGGMILLKRNTRKQEIITNLTEDNDFLQIEISTLWVNKGSFCEL